MKIDKAAYDYYNRLTSLFTLMRSVGVNYNQVTKAVHTNFNERRAVALLARLEKYTGEPSNARPQRDRTYPSIRAKMIGIISRGGSNLYGALMYNAEKVNAGQADLLFGNRVAMPSDPSAPFDMHRAMRSFEPYMNPATT